MKIFVNGKIKDEAKAVVSAFDRGFLYGDGLFETMRSYRGEVFALERHLDRLYNSADLMDLAIHKEKRYLKFVIYKLLKLNRLQDAYIRLAITRGEGRVGLDATTAEGNGIVVIVKKFTPYPEKLYKRGVTLYTSQTRRDEKSVLSRVKSLNYLNNIIARIEAQREGATDALLLNTRGYVAESAVSNIFMIKKKELVTPSLESGILPGITRESVLLLAKEVGLEPVERRIAPDEINRAREVFLTNTLMEVMPVVQIDKRKIKTGRPGTLTKKLHKLYRAAI